MAHIFSTSKSTRPKPKTHISSGHLPPYIEPSQPPTKKSPWRQLRSTPFISSLTITLPTATHNTLAPHTLRNPPPTYAKVILSLHNILTSPFFTSHIKPGCVQLISDGQPGSSDWVGTIDAGTLRIDMARDVYERCGLQGVPADRNGGARKHARERFVVQLDLKAPAAVRGKKGFERLVRAAEGVLGDQRVWLVRDVGGEERREGALDGWHPRLVEMVPEVRGVGGVVVPGLVVAGAGELVDGVPPLEMHGDYLEVVEWLDLVNLGSSRVTKGDDPDSFICRYSVEGADEHSAMDLTVTTWSGLLDSNWCIQVLIDIIRRSRQMGLDSWLAMTVNAHRTEALGQIDGTTILLQPRAADIGDEQGMDVDTETPTQTTSTIQNEGKGVNSGFHHFLCFQFVDTVTA